MKRGREAPAVRVEKFEGGQDVIGMIAPGVQVLISLYSLESEKEIALYNSVKNLLGGKKKIKVVFILSKDGKVSDTINHEDKLNEFQITFDKNLDYGKKFGCLIKEEAHKNRLVPSITIIELEGKIFYREVLENLDSYLDLEVAKTNVEEIFSNKKKGHPHEDWMRG